MLAALVILREVGRVEITPKDTDQAGWASTFIGASLMLVLIYPVGQIFKLLVFNSSFSLDLTNPFGLDVYSLIGLVITAVIRSASPIPMDGWNNHRNASRSCKPSHYNPIHGNCIDRLQIDDAPLFLDGLGRGDAHHIPATNPRMAEEKRGLQPAHPTIGLCPAGLNSVDALPECK